MANFQNKDGQQEADSVTPWYQRIYGSETLQKLRSSKVAFHFSRGVLRTLSPLLFPIVEFSSNARLKMFPFHFSKCAQDTIFVRPFLSWITPKGLNKLFTIEKEESQSKFPRFKRIAKTVGVWGISLVPEVLFGKIKNNTTRFMTKFLVLVPVNILFSYLED